MNRRMISPIHPSVLSPSDRFTGLLDFSLTVSLFSDANKRRDREGLRTFKIVEIKEKNTTLACLQFRLFFFPFLIDKGESLPQWQ